MGFVFRKENNGFSIRMKMELVLNQNKISNIFGMLLTSADKFLQSYTVPVSSACQGKAFPL